MENKEITIGKINNNLYEIAESLKKINANLSYIATSLTSIDYTFHTKGITINK